jgi:ribonuclease R
MTRRGPRGSRRAKSTDATPANPPDWRGEDPNLELEKTRYAEPIASRELLLKHLSEASEPLTAARLAKRLGLDTDRQREALSKRLAAMVRDGQAIEGPNGFATAGDGERVAGRVRGRNNGDVLVLPDDGSAPLIMARADTATLMHNDRVEVLAVGMNEKGRRIARLIQRIGDGPKQIGGVWHVSQGMGRVEPEDQGHWYSVEVPARHSHKAQEGDHVIVEVTRRPQGDSPAQGRVIEVLEDLRPSDLAARFAILRHDLPLEFPPEVLHEANRFDPDVRPEDREGREDLRELPLVTIDGEDAKDFDDAVYAEPVRGGGWRLVVAIADVSYYVRPGSPLDVEARSRATSVYFPDRVIAMLPEHLSNHLCSLMPRVERLAFVCDMRVSKTGKLSRGRFYEAVIRSHARLTYDQAWNYLQGLNGGTSPEPLNPQLSQPVRASLQALYAIYGALKKSRDARGALDFRGGETKARIGDDGKIEGFYAVMRNDAHRLIEECMVAANIEAAVALRTAKAGSLFRVHGQPEDKRVNELQKVLTGLQVGATFSEKPVGGSFGGAAGRSAPRKLGDSLAGAGGVSANQHRTFWFGAGRVCALYVSHTKVSGFVGASRPEGGGVAQYDVGSQVQQRGTADVGGGDLAARAACRRSVARCHELSQVSVPGAARRRNLRCDHYQRIGIWPVRAVERSAHRRLGAHLSHPGRLLGTGERRHGTGGATHRTPVADGRRREGAIEPRGFDPASDRFRIGRPGGRVERDCEGTANWRRAEARAGQSAARRWPRWRLAQPRWPGRRVTKWRPWPGRWVARWRRWPGRWVA